MDKEFAKLLALEQSGLLQMHPPRADAPRTPPWWPYDGAQLRELLRRAPPRAKDPWEAALAAGREQRRKRREREQRAGQRSTRARRKLGSPRSRDSYGNSG